MVSEVIPTRAGFLRDYSFVRDRASNMYWAEGEGQSAIKKRAPDGKITIHARADFRDVSLLTVTADGQLFVIDSGDLRHIAPDGRVTTTVAKLSGRQPAPATVADRHYHMGMWTDGAGSVYVAVAGERLVLKVQIDGRSQIVARSSGDWSPSGGILDRDGNLWLLEYSSTNAVRTRRIARNGSERIF